jgi:hypothetical protein
MMRVGLHLVSQRLGKCLESHSKHLKLLRLRLEMPTPGVGDKGDIHAHFMGLEYLRIDASGWNVGNEKGL